MTIFHAAAAALLVMATRGAAAEAPGSALPAAVEFFALPEAQSVAGRYGAAGASDDERLVYSNTLGHSVAGLLNGSFIADDLTLQAVDGCPLRRLVFHVTGKANPANAGGPFRVDWALYQNCPQAGGIVLVGDGGTPGDSTDNVPAQGFVEFASDFDGALQVVEFVAPAGSNIRLPSTTWLAVKANRANVGIAFGSPAQVGFSDDVFDFPLQACNADAGGYPSQPHASFVAELTVDSACAEAFPAYRNAHPGRAGYSEGRNECIADDIELNVTSCDMVGYEVTVRGQGSYRLELRGDQGGMPGPPIEGTLKSYFISAAAPPGSQKAHASFDPPIPIPSRLWATLQVSTSNGGWVFTRKPADIGTSITTYARSAAGKPCTEVDDWQTLLPSDLSAYGGFDVTIFCAGPPPVGACCDFFLDYSSHTGVCHEAAKMNCPVYGSTDDRYNRDDPPRTQWVEGQTCESQPFEHPCGTAACCLADRACMNITRDECFAIPAEPFQRTWHATTFCESGWLHCPVGECMVARTGPGCEDKACEEDVCGFDRWCCDVEWDAMCVRAAQDECGRRPPNYVCANEYPGDPSAILLPEDGSVLQSNLYAGSYEKGRPGFSCHRDGPDAWVEAITWYRFVAGDTSVRIHTCGSLEPAKDTLLAVYEPQDTSSLGAECDTLFELACSEDVAGCGGGVGSEVCVSGLVVGHPYYVQVAAHPEDASGLIQVDIETPCAQGVASTPLAVVEDPMPAPDSVERTGAIGELTKRLAGEPFEDTQTETDAPEAPGLPTVRGVARPAHVMRGEHLSVQVNVDAEGNNILGDAGHSVSLAVDPNFPNRMVIGWRQYDTVDSSFREAGYAYSHDYGKTWTFPGVTEQGAFRSNPVVDSGPDGSFYYYALRSPTTDEVGYLYTSTDGGVSWGSKRQVGYGNKPWMVVDKTLSAGRGHIYLGTGSVRRSTDGGSTFDEAVAAGPLWSTFALGTNGEVYAGGGDREILVARSLNAKYSSETAKFSPRVEVDLGGFISTGRPPNPGGFVGQVWTAVDHSHTSHRDDVYALASVIVANAGTDQVDVMFARSEDGGGTWSQPVRVNDDSLHSGAYQWFGTMSVAPNGRIDALWNDTRNSGVYDQSELFYSFSWDGGRTWSANEPVSPVFNSRVGWPNDVEKLGDYYQSVSDNDGVSIAYAATFNGEQDIYFLRIGSVGDCNDNGLPDLEEVTLPSTANCDGDGIPDDCEPDLDGDDLIDDCDDDVDGDGVMNSTDRCLVRPDERPVAHDGGPVGDTNGDCQVMLSDYWRFRNCMMDGRAGAPAPMGACLSAFDISMDGGVRLDDFAVFQNSYGGAR